MGSGSTLCELKRTKIGTVCCGDRDQDEQFLLGRQETGRDSLDDDKGRSELE